MVENVPSDVSLSNLSATTRQDEMHFDGSVMNMGRDTLHLQSSKLFSLGTTVQDTYFWNDDEQCDSLYQGPFMDLDFPLSLGHNQPEQMQVSPTDDASDDTPSSAPPPSFLGTRLSPDPQEGQDMHFDTFVQKAFHNRKQLYEVRDDRSDDITGLDSRLPNSRPKQTRYPPIMGAFPAELSEDNEAVWEPESLAHVRSLPQQTYQKIVSHFKIFNTTNDYLTQFATGDFPSLAACNAFLQLYFDEFNLVFPFIHQPSFDPVYEPWQLVLAVIATGSRFSREPMAVKSVDLLQDFVRRAFYATVSAYGRLMLFYSSNLPRNIPSNWPHRLKRTMEPRVSPGWHRLDCSTR